MSATNKFVRKDVIAAAKACYKAISAKRNRLIKSHVAVYMEPYKKYGWFGPTLTRTEDEARAYIAGKNLWDSLNFWCAESYGEDEQQALSRICRAAEACGGTYFQMTNKEFGLIASLYKKEEAQ